MQQILVLLHGMNWRVKRLVETRFLAVCDGLVLTFLSIICLSVGTWDVHGVRQGSTATALHLRT